MEGGKGGPRGDSRGRGLRWAERDGDRGCRRIGLDVAGRTLIKQLEQQFGATVWSNVKQPEQQLEQQFKQAGHGVKQVGNGACGMQYVRS